MIYLEFEQEQSPIRIGASLDLTDYEKVKRIRYHGTNLSAINTGLGDGSTYTLTHALGEPVWFASIVFCNGGTIYPAVSNGHFIRITLVCADGTRQFIFAAGKCLSVIIAKEAPYITELQLTFFTNNSGIEGKVTSGIATVFDGVITDANDVNVVNESINVEVQNAVLDTNVTNASLGVEILNESVNVNVTNVSLDVNAVNQPIDVNIVNETITVDEPIDVNIINETITVDGEVTATVVDDVNVNIVKQH